MQNVEINKSIKLSEHLALPSEAALSHLSELNGVHLSPHFTLGELTVTSVKTADKNIPSHVAIENLKRLCKWLEHLRAQYNLRYSDGSHPIICGGFCLDHLRRGLALGSGPDEKVASDFTSVPDPSARRLRQRQAQCEAVAAGAERSARRCGGCESTVRSESTELQI